ncbi:hypothetical protein [Rhizobium sp. 11515TR]|uniref:hypothetical protein n=1 Tax=unclassified Rhizobium TaxID=2613769 RepID=UPI001FCECB58|nr:hypothetical protein [Rhizobium sp. 11515TR]
MAGLIRVYRYLLALLALSGIAISYFAIIPGAHVSRLTMTVNFFSYFTMQSNLLLAMTLLCAQIAPLSSIGNGRASRLYAAPFFFTWGSPASFTF